MSISANTRAVLALLAASFLFGATFVVIKTALDDIGSLSLVAWRFLIGAIVLALLAVPRGRALWYHGGIAGLALFAGYAFQTAGLVETTASNSALITGLYVVITPFLSAAFNRRSPSRWVVVAAAGSFVGLVLLTETEGLSLQGGDLLTLGCAVSFAFHIVALARYAPHHPVVPFTAVQLGVTALLAFVAAFAVEGISVPARSVWGALIMTGIGVSVLAFLLQVWAQTVIGASTAAVILGAEPAFGVATAWVVLGETLDAKGWIGAALIFAAILVVVTLQRDQSFKQAEAVTPAH
ncbi:MAG: DMT family transporter [Acidimicrobiia bacterium]|nr:DMT family transporter [Acidimicrobiia bacterium]